MNIAARHGEETAKMVRGKIQDAPKLDCEDLATLEYPSNHDTQSSKFDKWSACLSSDESTVFVMFSDQDFGWIYKYEFDEHDQIKLAEEKDNRGVKKQNPFLVTQKLAVGIYYLNHCQVVI